jgi:hypothetical protein
LFRHEIEKSRVSMSIPRPREKAGSFLPSGIDRQKLLRIFLAVFILVALILILAGAVPLGRRLVCAFQVNQAEALNAEHARILMRGEPLYHDLEHGPYIYTPYPPLFPLLQAFFGTLFATGPWLPGRLLAFAGYLGCAAALLYWGWRRWDKTISLALACLFLLSPTWASWGTMVRSDSLMLLTGFCAFLLLSRHEELEPKGKVERGNTDIAVAGLLTALSFFLKQNAILLVFAFGVFCLLRSQWKKLFLFLVCSLGPVLLVSAWLQWSTHGEYLKYTFLWVPYGFEWRWLTHYLGSSFAPECGWLVVAVLLTRLFRKTSLFSRCRLAFAALWVFGLGRQASAENYYLDFILYGVFFLGEGWGRGWSENFRKGLPDSRLVFPVILLCGLFFFSQRSWPSIPSAWEMEMKAEMFPVYAGAGEHLALDPDLLVMAGKRLWIQPMEYTQMVEKGYWNAEPLLEDIRSKKFTTIELYDMPRQYLLPQVTVDEISRNYHVVIRKYGRLWLKPKRP